MEKLKVDNKVVAFVHDGTVVVDNSAFERLTLVERAGFLTSIAGKGILQFRADFTKFNDYPTILSRLKQGDNVVFELLFNDVEVTEEQQSAVKAYHAAIAPIIEKISSLIPPYPFIQKPSKVSTLMVHGQTVQNSSGYSVSLDGAKRIFDKATKYWSGISKKPEEYHETTNSGGRYVAFNPQTVAIGCQSIHRWSIEQLGLSQGWSFPDGTAVKPVTPVKAKKVK